MAWTDQVYRYCERGQDGAFWAEPWNALSNAAFIIAALAAGYELRRRGAREPVAATALILVVFAIGIGSFLFHTFATRWAALADVIPIGVFMLAYLGYALRSFMRLGWLWVAMLLAGFIWLLRMAGTTPCPSLASIVLVSRGSCLNGTLAYAPALIAMLAAGVALALLRHRAAIYLGAAGLVFLASMTFRTIDLMACERIRFLGQPVGTHALWHLLNAATLYVLLVAAIRHGGRPGAVASAPPRAHKSRFRLMRADVVEPVDTQDLKS